VYLSQAVVAKLQGDDPTILSAPADDDGVGTGATTGAVEAWGDAGATGGGGSKLASAKRGQIAKARHDTAAHRPPRPSSAPPGRQPLPQSRPSSATPVSAANQGVGIGGGVGGISGVGMIQGRSVPPRPASAMHRNHASRPGSAMSRE